MPEDCAQTVSQSEGPTGGSRRTAASGDVSDVHNIDPDAGHNLAERACDEGEHNWIMFEESVDRRPFLRPSPLVCQFCDYSLQAIALTLGQEVDP